MSDIGGKTREATAKDGWRETGQQRFDAMTTEEQDVLLGPDKAKLVREGKVELSDLVQVDKQDEGPDFISSKPLQDLPESS